MRVSSTYRKLALAVVVLLGSLVALLAIAEAMAYVNRTEEGARERALTEFQRVCDKRCAEVGMIGKDFSGPTLSAKTSRAYSFLWRARKNDTEILVTVSYGPRWTESWFIRH